MRLFACQGCGQTLHFENDTCLGCGRALGYLPGPGVLAALEPAGADWQVLPAPDLPGGVWRRCGNAATAACNWMIPVAGDGSAPALCSACAHNRLIPDLSDPLRLALWRKAEGARRRLIYQLDRLELPRPSVGDGHPRPLIFDTLDDAPGMTERVMTGHAEGVITLALAEADDAHREAERTRLGEGYRTLLGHLRHEVGHYYWDLLVRDGGQVDAFRAIFGDESQDYGAALARHYEQGPPPDWSARHVSPYASAHPWEDWAETWAHYLHMTETLETAAAWGLRLAPDTQGAEGRLDLRRVDPWDTTDIGPLFDAWLPLSVALNALARSMGQPDPYPFVLPPPVLGKLGFVHDLVRNARTPQRQ